MAVTSQNSTQLGRHLAAVPSANDTQEWGGKKRIQFAEAVQSGIGDATSTIRMFKVPAGRVRVLLNETYLSISALGAARTADFGWEAYTDLDGVAVVADPNGLDDGVDVSSAAVYSPTGTIGGLETKLFESQDGVVLAIQINDAQIDDAETFDGYLTYVYD